MAATVPHRVYAQQLFKCGWGYPLWEPEPEEPRDEVLIGDVGYLEHGGFCRLFNAIKDRDDHIQTREFPPEFERFNPGPDPSSSVRRKTNAVSEGPHASATVHRVEVGVQYHHNHIGRGRTLHWDGSAPIVRVPWSFWTLREFAKSRNRISR